MKTIVKAIESMLTQDATQQWTAAPIQVGPVVDLELDLNLPLRPSSSDGRLIAHVERSLSCRTPQTRAGTGR